MFGVAGSAASEQQAQYAGVIFRGVNRSVTGCNELFQKHFIG
jgi:hypothetical protein